MDSTLSSDMLLVAVSTRGELARQYVTVHNPAPSRSKTPPSPGVFLRDNPSSNKTHITLEQFWSDVAVEANSNSTLTTSVQSPGLPIKLTKRKLPQFSFRSDPIELIKVSMSAHFGLRNLWQIVVSEPAPSSPLAKS